MKRALFGLLLLIRPALNATPAPSGGSGTPGHNNNYTVNGLAFLTKTSPIDATAKPAYYVDFEDGTLTTVTALSAGSLTLGQQNMSVVTEARGSSAKMVKSAAINWAQWQNGGIVAIDILMPAGSAARNAKVYKGTKRKSSRSSYTHLNGAVTQFENWKFDRFWPQTNGSGYPNTYSAQNADSSSSCTGGGSKPAPTVEAGSGSNYVKTSSSLRFPGSTWMFEERLLKYNSANAVGDGIYKVRQDGQVTASRTDWVVDPSASFVSAGLRRWYTQDYPANLSDCGGSTVSHDVWYDDAVYDYGTDAWARVMLGDAATLAACTILEYQPASTWSNTSITFKQKFGSLTTAQNKYIYVFDRDDTVNASGLLLQAGVGNPAPTLTSISVSTANYLGGTTSTATGTGFISGITCSFGPNPATVTTFSNSTTLFLTAPAGASAATVDLVCTNSDAQSATLSAAVAYTRAAEIPIFADDDPIRDGGRSSIFRR